MLYTLSASLLIWSCAPTIQTTDTVSAQSNGTGTIAAATPLDRSTENMIAVDLPESSYEEAEVIPITSGWKLVGIQEGIRIWETKLPIRSRSLFFYSAPAGMKLLQRTEADEDWNTSRGLKFNKRMPKKADTWNMSSHSLRVHRPPEAGAPQSWEYAVHYPKAEQRERILADTNTKDPKAYVLRQQQIEDDTRHGLYLPSPSSIEYAITVPTNGKFQGELVLIPPEAADPALHSDGASLEIWAETSKGDRSLLKQMDAIEGEYQPINVSLAEYAGQTITLNLVSKSGPDTAYDYLFVADPIVYQPKADPKRVVWVFIDTLRQDHLSMYGYERETTPKLDAWAKVNAGIYSEGRSIAPWTLPSARTMVTGSVPEKWGVAPTFQKQLAEQGWYTSFLVGNIYLSSNFELQKDWSSHRCINWPLAEVQIERAEGVLNKYDDRDVFLMLHFMDMHLPYTEPPSYKNIFAGDRPDVFKSDSFGRSEILRNKRKLGESGKQYIIDRYDNNLKYIDDVLTPFLERLPEDTMVAIFSDHGEEFWDHGDFEHGHTLYDELLNVPYILKMPGIEVGMHDEPVSLLDLVPTTAKALGIEIEPTQGWALQDHSATDLKERPQAFGRMLYGDDGWGSLHNDLKYASLGGKETMFDLSVDPEEMTALENSQAPQGRNALSDALNRPVELGFRLELSQPRTNKKEVSAVIRMPSGLKRAWRGSDPTARVPMTVDYTEDTAVFTWEAKNRGSREAFFVTTVDAMTALENLQVSMLVDGKERDLTALHIEYPEYDGRETKLMRGKLGQQTMTLSFTMTPIPSDEDLELDAFDDEVSEELKVLGYME